MRIHERESHKVSKPHRQKKNCCSDNSWQLRESKGKTQMWKIQHCKEARRLEHDKSARSKVRPFPGLGEVTLHPLIGQQRLFRCLRADENTDIYAGTIPIYYMQQPHKLVCVLCHVCVQCFFACTGLNQMPREKFLDRKGCRAGREGLQPGFFGLKARCFRSQIMELYGRSCFGSFSAAVQCYIVIFLCEITNPYCLKSRLIGERI